MEERSPSRIEINGGLGVMRLPVGYRFHPTDEELVVHYLKRKASDLPLPASVIPHLDDVFHTPPWSLPGDLKEKRYFFCRRERNIIDGNVRKRKRVKTTAGSGYWKPIGRQRKIVDSVSDEVVGLRKSLVFFCQSIPHFENTNTKWVMHEYSLFGNQISKKKSVEGTWLVYCLFQKKRKPNKRHAHGVINYIDNEVIDRPSFVDFMAEADDHEGPPPPQPSSPCFSEVTHEISSCGYLSEHEQEGN